MVMAFQCLDEFAVNSRSLDITLYEFRRNPEHLFQKGHDKSFAELDFRPRAVPVIFRPRCREIPPIGSDYTPRTAPYKSANDHSRSVTPASIAAGSR